MEKPKPSVVLKAEDVISSGKIYPADSQKPLGIDFLVLAVTSCFVFEKSEGNVGEPLQAQLIISSFAHPSAAPIRLSEVKIVFEGSLRPVKIQSDESKNPDTTTPCTITSISLRSSSMTDSSTIQSPTSGLTALTGIADLTIGPLQTKVLNLTCIPREAGEARVASIAMLIEEEKFDLAYVITEQTHREVFWWQQTSKGASRRRVGKGRDTGRCKIRPKPPKIRITTPNLKDTYYTNERIVLTIGIHNDEEEAADLSAESRLFGRLESTAKVQWLDGEKQDTADSPDATEKDPHFISRPIGVMERSSKQELAMVLGDTHEALDYHLEISAVYHLLSDVQTPIVKTVTVGLSIIRPFEANYDFLPRLHPEPWPDFFQVDDDMLEDEPVPKPRGLQQRWCLDAKIVSFALEPLIIKRVSAVLLGVGGGAACDIGSEVIASPETPEIAPEELRESQFALDIQKIILGDRRPTALNLALEIQWRRRDPEGQTLSGDDSETLSTSALAIPRFVVPAGEPRVLASAMASETLSGLVHVDYTLENPSTHFLTFNLTMEASEQFAFSGPKTTVVQLVPLSRHTVRYNLLAVRRGLWIQPQLIVVDTYFNKMLQVLPTEEMRLDKKGLLVWVDAED